MVAVGRAGLPTRRLRASRIATGRVVTLLGSDGEVGEEGRRPGGSAVTVVIAAPAPELGPQRRDRCVEIRLPRSRRGAGRGEPLRGGRRGRSVASGSRRRRSATPPQRSTTVSPSGTDTGRRRRGCRSCARARCASWNRSSHVPWISAIRDGPGTGVAFACGTPGYAGAVAATETGSRPDRYGWACSVGARMAEVYAATDRRLRREVAILLPTWPPSPTSAALRGGAAPPPRSPEHGGRLRHGRARRRRLHRHGRRGEVCSPT